MTELDEATKARIRAEEEERARVRAELEGQTVQAAAAPAATVKKGGLGCFGWGVLIVIGAFLYFACNAVNNVNTGSLGLTPDGAGSSTTSSSEWSYTGIGNGTQTIGNEMQSGRWRTRAAASNCYWARLSGFSGEMGEIISNENARGPAIVDIGAGDKGFESRGCAPWTQDLSAITTSPTAPFDDGTYLVGTDISPGTWRAANPDDCYWARLSRFGGNTSGIIANENGVGVVRISSDDVGFTSNRCGGWTMQ